MSCRDISGDTPSNFRIPNVEIITTNSTYTSPPGVDYLEVYAIGGGGGGGGGSVANNQGSGGGAGAPSFKFFPPGTYDIIIGAGGAGGVGTGNGSAGGDTDFGTGQLIGKGGGGGAGGNVGVRRGGLAGAEDPTATYTLAREAGGAGTKERSGNGGSNYFGTGGGAFSDPAGVTELGNQGSGLGGGASGGNNSVGARAGANGGVIIIEHY